MIMPSSLYQNTASSGRKTEFLLRNDVLEIGLSAFGASVRTIKLLFLAPELQNIALTLKTPPGAFNPIYAGATLAPSAGRVKDGLLPIGQTLYHLTKNENQKTHLHGGGHNLSFCEWEVSSAADASVTFRNFLPDGLDGYPGNRRFLVSYTLEDASLTIRFQADSDRKTYFNLSNHTYFNLNAFSRSGLEQYLQIQADRVVLNDKDHIPVSIQDVGGTPFDLRKPTLLSDRLRDSAGDPDILSSKGFNHYYLFSKDADGRLPDCRLICADQSLAMDLFTDAPALVFYSGGFLEEQDHFVWKNTWKRTGPGCAVALEPSGPPLNLISFDGHTSWERRMRLQFHAL